eukprot:CFRG1236T1
MSVTFMTVYDSHQAMVDTLILGAVLSAPHALYRYVWENPQSFQKQCEKVKKDPVVVLSKMGALLKAIQFSAYLLWLYRTFQDDNRHSTDMPRHHISLGTSSLALILVAFGQVLNFFTYKALKMEGIYYGAKLGKSIPWVHGFPFNTFSHPQYLGCVFTIWGATLLILGAMQFYRWMYLLGICAWWTLLYVFSIKVESR